MDLRNRYEKWIYEMCIRNGFYGIDVREWITMEWCRKYGKICFNNVLGIF